MTDKEAIERLKSIDETTEEYDGNLFKADFETVLNLIEKQQAEIEYWKEQTEGYNGLAKQVQEDYMLHRGIL